MSNTISTVTQKGQVTIPLEVRKILGIVPYDQVLFQVENGRVEIKPSKMTLKDTYKAVPALAKSVSLNHMKQIVSEERAEKYKKKNEKGK